MGAATEINVAERFLPLDRASSVAQGDTYKSHYNYNLPTASGGPTADTL